MKRITIISAIALSALLSTSAFAVNQGAYGELGLGAAHFNGNVLGYNFNSDTMLHLKGGVGYRSCFSSSTPLFWGVDARLNNYDTNSKLTSGDFGAMLGVDFNRELGAYAKVGGEYFFNGNDLRPKFGLGLNYAINKKMTLNLEVAATNLHHSSAADVYLTSGTVGMQFNF